MAVVVLGIVAAAISAVVVLQMLAASRPAASVPSDTATPSSSPTVRATPSPRPTPTATAEPSPTATLSPILAERFTMLIAGTDGTASRAAKGQAPLTDAILVVSVSPNQSSVALISIPRDTVDVPMPNGENWSQKINAIYANAGVTALRGSVERTLGIQIDRHVVLDMDAFRVLIDMLGGIEIDVEYDIVDPTVDLFIPGGIQHLDAAAALAYARHRAQGGDHVRAERHQRLVLSLVARVATLDRETLAELHHDLGSVLTDVTAAELPILLELARRSEDAEIRSVVLKAPEFALFEGLQGDRGWILVPDLEAIRAAVDGLTD